MVGRLKKAVLLTLVFGLAGIMGMAVSHTVSVAYQTTQIDLLTDADRHRELITVYNADSVAHESGDVVVWYDGTTADGLEITTTTTANNALVAGVVAIRTIAATSWGFIQTRGYHSGVTVGVAVSTGNALITSTTGESATKYTLAYATGAETDEGVVGGQGIFAVAFESATTSTTVKAILK